MKATTLTYEDGTTVIMKKDHGRFAPMTDSQWQPQIAHYRYLTDKAKLKFQRKKLEDANVVCKAKATRFLPNNHAKLMTPWGNRDPDLIDYHAGLMALLSLVTLFPDPAVGYTLLATILCGFRAYSLRQVEPSFTAVMSINCGDYLYSMLCDVIHFIIPRTKWKCERCRIYRDAVLDLTEYTSTLQNFSRIQVKTKKVHSVDLPFPYFDTMTLVAQAVDRDWKALSPHLLNAGILLVNCRLTGAWGTSKLPHFSVDAFDEEVADSLIGLGPQMAALLRLWWNMDGPETPEDWASRIIQAARDSFGRIDGRFVSVEYDPTKLRLAVCAQVVQSFLNELTQLGIASEEELAPYRVAAEAAFCPPQPESDQPKRAEDPEVFLTVMSKLVTEHPDCVAEIDEPCYKGRKAFFAAWRDISGVRHLVIEEESWKTAYAKAARGDKKIDGSILQIKDWDLEILKNLVGAGVIKAASSGYRYRYDLFRTGSKVNVLAIAADRLSN